MIPKLSSQELNEIYDNAKLKLENINQTFDRAKNDLDTKMKIINYEADYINSIYESIRNGSYITNKGMVSFYNLEEKRFKKYGNIVHAELVKEPINIFNINMSGLGEKYFRDDVSVSINNKSSSLYTSILKDEVIEDKEIYFDLRSESTLTLAVKLNDTSCILGSTRCNCIEIDPFLPGSFDINQIRIYSFEKDGSINNETQPYIINDIHKVGRTRFVLDKKINFYKIEFDITINYQTYRNTSVVFPFGIKHLFFYDMDFKTDSYLIAEINTTNNISYIKDDIIVVTAYNSINTTISNEGITLFSENNDGALSYQIEPAQPTNISELPIDTKKLYAKVPLSTSSVLKGIIFFPVERNN